MMSDNSWNAKIFFWFSAEKNAENAKKALEAETDVSFERSETVFKKNGRILECQIKAGDYSVWKAKVHGTIKSVALVQQLQSTQSKHKNE
ncbi:MAG: KEOPS complex subunit Pcc1 [Candidatus Micrarchaeota archaeon]